MKAPKFKEFIAEEKLKPYRYVMIWYDDPEDPDEPEKTADKIIEEGKKNNVYFRTLGNIVMLVPPLAISQKDLNFLIDGTIKTITTLSKKI